MVDGTANWFADSKDGVDSALDAMSWLPGSKEHGSDFDDNGQDSDDYGEFGDCGDYEYGDFDE